MRTCGSGGLYCMPGGRTLMKGGTFGKRERRRGERSSQAIFTFALNSYFPPVHALLFRLLFLLVFLSVDFQISTLYSQLLSSALPSCPMSNVPWLIGWLAGHWLNQHCKSISLARRQHAPVAAWQSVRRKRKRTLCPRSLTTRKQTKCPGTWQYEGRLNVQESSHKK